MNRRKYRPLKHKPMTIAKKLKLQKHIDWLMSKGVKDKGRCKKPALTNNYGNIIKTRR